MAASPMAAFPVINTLATVHLYRHLRTDHRAGGAPCALTAVVKGRGQIARGIQLVRKHNHFFWAEKDAEFASLA